MNLLFCHRGILSTLMVHGRISNALLAATLQMEENRLWSIKMKLDVSTALKSRGEKCFFWGICCCQLVWATCCNAGNGATLLLSSLPFVRVCVHQSKGRPGWIWGKRHNRRKYSEMMARMRKTSSQSRVRGSVLMWAASSIICRLHLSSVLPAVTVECHQDNDVISFSSRTNEGEWLVSVSKSSMTYPIT